VAPIYYVRVRAKPGSVATSSLGPFDSLLEAVKAVYAAKLEDFEIEERADERAAAERRREREGAERRRREGP
jgi:hypothetical protein